MSNAAARALMTMEFSEADAWMRQSAALFDQLLRQCRAYPAMVLPDPDNPAIVCGIVHAAGVGEVWMVTGKAFEGSLMWGRTLRQQRQLCRSMYRVLNLHRMHMLVDASRDEARAWAGALGFEKECTVARMGARGEDMEYWVWPHSERGRSWAGS